MLERLPGCLGCPSPDQTFVPVGVAEPGACVRAVLEPVSPGRTGGGRGTDVTGANAIAALEPLLVSLDPDALGTTAPSAARLVFYAARDGRVLGELRLERSDEPVVAGRRLAFYEVRAHRNGCVSPACALAMRLALEWRAFRAPPGKPSLPAVSTLALAVFYVQPRPVYLMTCQAADRWECFPMDLIGQLGRDHVSLALRKTSPAHVLLEARPELAMTRVPESLTEVAYAQARRREPLRAPGDAGIPVAPSTKLGILAPTDGLWVRELRLLGRHDAGSHWFYVARVEHEGPLGGEGVPLCHVQGFDRSYL